LFAHNHPSVHVLVEEDTGDALIAKQRQGGLDIVLAYRPLAADGIRFESLYIEEMMLVVGQDHPMAQRRRVRMVELHRREVVLPPRQFTTRQQIDEAFRTAGAEPLITIEMVSITAILELVARTALATIVSRSAWSEHGTGLRAIPLEAPTLVRNPGLIWTESPTRLPAAAAFASIVRSVAKATVRDHKRTGLRAT
jgi:LysR family cyn operon transcriptional activator